MREISLNKKSKAVIIDNGAHLAAIAKTFGEENFHFSSSENNEAVFGRNYHASVVKKGSPLKELLDPL